MKKIISLLSIVLVIIIIVCFSIYKIKNSGNKDYNGNIANMGLVTQYKGKTYYNKYEKGIFEVSENSEKQLTDETAYSLTPHDNKIYYMSVADFNNVVIKYVDLNTEEVKNITTVYTSISKFFINDKYIYYFTSKGNKGIARAELNGENETIVVQGNIADFQVSNDEIYYINEANQICKFSVKNHKDVILNEEIRAKKLQIADNWVYYYDENENALFRFRKDGKKKELISTLVNNEIYNVCGKYVYYLDEQNSKIARMQIRKSSKCDDIVNIEIVNTKINIAGDILYYLDKSSNESQTYQMYRVKTDGDEIQNIEY